MKYWETEEFKAQQAEWYRKLAEDGFKDIEDHIEWRLKGSAAMVSLNALREELGSGYTAHDIDQLMDSSAPVFDYHNSRQAKYFAFASELVAQGYRAGRDGEMLEAWQGHAEGLSERKIAESMSISRFKVRSHLEGLRKMLHSLLTSSES